MPISKLRKLLNDKIFSLAKEQDIQSNAPLDWEDTPWEPSTRWKQILSLREFGGIVGIAFHNREEVTNQIHYHKYHEHIIVLQGTVHIFTPTEVKILHAGDVYTIEANVQHHGWADKDTIQIVLWQPVGTHFEFLNSVK